MKQFQNTAIFLLLFLTILLKDSVVSLIKQTQKEPIKDPSLEISYQNLLEKYQEINHYLNLQPEQEETRIHSRVLFRDPFDFFGIITIEKGKLDGIVENAAVFSEDGLLGVVVSIQDHTSKVKLLTNTETTLSVKCNDSYGILETNSQKEQWIKNLTKETEVEIGSVITTSGLTEVPGNIKIGTVEKIEKDSLGLIQSIQVKPSANFYDIKYVTILYQTRES